MKRTNKHNETARTVFMDSIGGLANVLALIITFLGVAPAYGHSIQFVQNYTAQNYGYGFEDLVAIVWFAMCAALIFFISRASVSTLLTMGGLALAARIF